MRVFYTTSVQYDESQKGGSGAHICSVVSNLREAGHDVSLYVCSAEGEIGRSREMSEIVYTGTLPKSLTGVVGFNWNYWRLLRHDANLTPDALYVRFGVWQFAPIWFASRHRIPVVLELNGVPDMDRNLGFVHAKIIRWMFRAADRIVVTADAMGDYFSERYGVTRSRFSTVSNGVDTSLYKPLASGEQRLFVPKGCPAIGYFGLLAEHWGLDLLWKAAPEILKSVPDARFVIAGEGPEESQLREEFKRLGLEKHLLLLGGLSYEDAARAMAECDALVGPLRPVPRNEMSSPMKIYHYLAAGVPSVASDMKVMEQFAGSGLKTFPPEDAKAFAKQILECLAMSGEEKRRWGMRSHLFIEENYTWTHTVSRLEKILGQVVSEKK